MQAVRLGRIAVRHSKPHGVFRRMCGEPPKPPKVELPPKVGVAQVSPHVLARAAHVLFWAPIAPQHNRNARVRVRNCVCVCVCFWCVSLWACDPLC